MKKSTLAIILGGALLTGTAVAHQAGDVIFRAGAVHVKANSSSDAKSKAATGIDVDLEVKNNTQLGLTATYMLADNVGIELLGATPFSHKINAKAKVLESGAEVDLDRVVILKQLPPSLYAQYYFFEPTAKVKPYVGAGLNYTRFYHAKSVSPAVTDLSVKKHSFGPVANLGVDVKLTDNIYFNAAAWYTRIKTTAKFKAAGADHEVKVKLDPVVLFAGFGVKF
ncbi:Outer membrane protein W precursor [Mannheimia haemolytica]|uniref:Outer membrane protein W n=1 Tax=Mannheimia haemolytica TaxID=75985 RepID=A0A3S4XN53_MANHA|nr:OmpW family outer membrane protein [Mannheimia haemolytica]VEI76861.1 Outer membrane protein W precursor [Mannheimia haemolytica]HDV7284681.1 outer membrane beta-barrel protein [Mannheimia haemolytica]